MSGVSRPGLVQDSRPVKKVLLAIDRLCPAGAERQLALLATNLPPAWKAYVWTVDGGSIVDDLKGSGVEVRVAGRSARWDFRFFFDLWRTIRRVRPDVFHSWGWMASSAAIPACGVLGIPFIDGSIRKGVAPTKRGLINRINFRLARLVIANSRAGLLANNIPERKGRVVHNGFDAGRLANEVERFPAAAGRTTVIMTGRMTREKDWWTFLDAARLLGEQEPGRWLFLAVGGGLNQDSVLEAGKDLAERGDVIFVAPRLEVVGLVRGADIGVLLTSPQVHAEGQANALMEYMACGLPVVCTEGGGNPELVDDGRSGFIIPPGDLDAFVDRLRFLRDNPAEAKQMGLRGREHVLTRLTVERMALEMTAVYDEVIDAEA